MQRLKSILSALLPLTVPLLVTIIAVELYQLRSELKGIRQEQVKNASYALRPEVMARLATSSAGQLRLRKLASSVTLEPDYAIPVTVQGSDLEPIRIQADDPIPVEIQR